MIVVADTSPPLHLGRIGRLDLLPTVVGRVIVPRTIWNELTHPETRADVSAALRSASWIDVVDDARCDHPDRGGAAGAACGSAGTGFGEVTRPGVQAEIEHHRDRSGQI